MANTSAMLGQRSLKVALSKWEGLEFFLLFRALDFVKLPHLQKEARGTKYLSACRIELRIYSNCGFKKALRGKKKTVLYTKTK